jgi:branched-chain amino acid transport system permease protein
MNRALALRKKGVGSDLWLRAREQRAQLAALAAALVVLAVLPVVTPASLLTIATTDLIFLQLAYAWNLVGGFLGELSLGHMIFWAVGSFGVILAINHGLPVPAVLAGLVLAGAAAGVGMALAIRLARLEGLLYVAIFTLILGEICASVASNWQPFGASTGIVAVRLPGIGPDGQYELLAGAVLVAVAANVWVSLTRRGIRWQAIRDDASAAETAGVRITRERAGAYALSAALCVLGGAFQGYYTGSASATVSLDVSVLITVSLAVFVGGPGTLLGPLAGALVIYGLGSVVTSVSTSVNASLYAQVAEFAVALIALRLLVPRLGNRDLLSGIGWLLASRVPRLLRGRGTRRSDADQRQPGPAQPGTSTGQAILPPPGSPPPGSPPPGSPPPGSPPPGGGPLVIDGVGKAFGHVTVLRGVSFQVEPGQVVGLLGANGAGKSTLCNILSGLLQADQGAVLLGGTDLARIPVTERARLGVGRSFQTPRLFPTLSLRDNLAVSTAIGHGQAGEILHALAVADADTRVSRESEFFARRLAEVARAVFLGRQLLLLDEPLAGLTEDQHTVVLGLARQAAKGGSRVILVEHLVPVVAPMVDKLVVLAGGVVIADGPPAEVLADAAVIDAYLGSALVVES